MDDLDAVAAALGDHGHLAQLRVPRTPFEVFVVGDQLLGVLAALLAVKITHALTELLIQIMSHNIHGKITS